MKILILLSLVISSSAFSQNFITTNASFEKGLSGWEHGVANSTDDVNNIPEADFNVVEDLGGGDSVLKVKVRITTKLENLNDVYLLRRGLKFKKGKKYRTTFFVKSTTRDDQLLASIGSGSADDFESLTKRTMKFEGDNTWKRISFTFQIGKNNPNVNFKDLCFVIGLNHRFGTFYLKDFSIKPM